MVAVDLLSFKEQFFVGVQLVGGDIRYLVGHVFVFLLPKLVDAVLLDFGFLQGGGDEEDIDWHHDQCHESHFPADNEGDCEHRHETDDSGNDAVHPPVEHFPSGSISIVDDLTNAAGML